MTNKEKLTKINNELKVYINESSFISMKCRNKVLKYFSEDFNVNLDISNYKNVDLKLKEDGTVIYRDDKYKSDISSFKELEERYNIFKEKADKLISKKEIDFNNMSNMNNVTNLLMVIGLILICIIILILGISALLSGDWFDCLWFVIFILPWIFPKLKNALQKRLVQAKNYLKKLIKKV